MESGGIIVCDDYGQSTSPGATQAVDRFLADKPETMLMLPEGGGFLIVKTATASPARLEQRIPSAGVPWGPNAPNRRDRGREIGTMLACRHDKSPAIAFGSLP